MIYLRELLTSLTSYVISRTSNFIISDIDYVHILFIYFFLSFSDGQIHRVALFSDTKAMVTEKSDYEKKQDSTYRKHSVHTWPQSSGTDWSKIPRREVDWQPLALP